jgi:hypothetical protein
MLSADEGLDLFNWREEKHQQSTLNVRETLFGDVPLGRWAPFSTQAGGFGTLVLIRASHSIH